MIQYIHVVKLGSPDQMGFPGFRLDYIQLLKKNL